MGVTLYRRLRSLFTEDETGFQPLCSVRGFLPRPLALGWYESLRWRWRGGMIGQAGFGCVSGGVDLVFGPTWRSALRVERKG